MSITFRDGTVNIAAITTPGVAIDIIAPTPFLTGVPTCIQAYVGVASWGTPNTMQSAATAADGYAKLGRPQVRYGDLATALAVALSQGTQGSYRFVRVTDGTDLAASVALPANIGRFTARSTGTLGNRIGIGFAASSAPGALKAVVSFPGILAEQFDAIFTGLASVAVSAGAGYAAVPVARVSAPQKALSAVQATVQPTLAVVGAPTLSAPGTGFAVNEVVSLGAGVTIKVLSISGGGATGPIATFALVSAGQILSGAVPATVGQQTASTGSGTGAAFGLSWGLGQPIFTAGGGYFAASGPAMTITLQGGSPTTPGSYTPALSFGAALATAINLGTQLRAASGYVVFTPGTGTGAPALNTPFTLAGGTDGDVGVTAQIQAGQDGSGSSRTGAYVLRGSGMDTFTLVDCNDPTIYPAMLALAIDETAGFSFSTGSGDTIPGAIAERLNFGFDDVDGDFIVGDMPTFNDGVNGPRLVYPSLFALALYANLSPEQSPINKPLLGVLATQGSSAGIPISNPDNALAQDGGIDIIGRTAALGAPYFSLVTGRSTSSNTAARGVEYRRLTNFIARSLAGPATRAVVGLLQSTKRADDPTRTKAKAILDGFGGVLTNPAFGSGGYGVIEDWATQCDLNNNPAVSVQQGFLIAYVSALYLNAVRVFLVKFAGGGNVQVQQAGSQATSVTQALAALAGTTGLN